MVQHDISLINKILPHKKPFLFLDRLDSVNSPQRGRGYVKLAISRLRHLPYYSLNLILVEFAAQASAYVAVYCKYEAIGTARNQGYLVTLKNFTALQPYAVLKEDTSFAVDVVLENNYKTLYRYTFDVEGFITGELEFITNQ